MSAVRPARWVRLGVLGVLLGLVAVATPAQDDLEVRTYSYTAGPYDLPADKLMQMPEGELDLSFRDPIWVLSYQTEILDPGGELLIDTYHCHTTIKTDFTNDWRSWAMENKKLDSMPFRGLFSDGHTTKIELPEGFGVFFDPGESIKWMPMFNNREPDTLRASMRFTMEYVPRAEGDGKLKPLYGTIQSVQYPHLYEVAPGIDTREIDFSFAYSGTIHFMGVHIHPYGKTVELINVSKDETVWVANGNRNDQGRLIDMPVYSSVKGYAFNDEDTYRLRVVYDNPTPVDQDAMGGIFILFSTENDEMPVPELTGEVKPGESPKTHHHH